MKPPTTDTQHQLELMQDILALVSSHTLSIDERLIKILELGNRLFHQQIAVISHIKEQQYIVDHVVAPNFNIEPGQAFSLDDTLCSKTFNAQEAVCISQTSGLEPRRHPCLDANTQSYIGTLLKINGQIYGTLSFSSINASTGPLPDDYCRYIETLGEWISNLVSYSSLVNKITNYAGSHAYSGLLNEDAFIEKLERCISRAHQTNDYSFAILSIDTGITQVRCATPDDIPASGTDDNLTTTLQQLIRPRDSIGCRDNNEFVILLEDVVQPVLAKKIAYRIENKIRGSRQNDTIAIGAVINNGTDGASDLLSNASQMMHIAQQDGGGVCISE